jgi:metallophosphoesterase (TIGR00282 family)
VKILFCGDVVGRSGREAIQKHLPGLRTRLGIDFAVVNGENAAGGVGITDEIAREFYEAGADAVTTGNHVWDRREIIATIDRDPRLLRPQNFPKGTPGKGVGIYQAKGKRVMVMNLMGRLFMDPLDDPFAVAEKELASQRLGGTVDAILIDFHAEATSEKIAMGWHLDGKVTLVVGTHTHVQTADERILPNGTAYMTDAGMTGPHDGIIGMEREPSLERFLNGMPSKLEPATANPRLNGILVSADEKTGRATAITRLSYSEQDLAALASQVRAGMSHDQRTRPDSRIPDPGSRVPS